MRALGWVWLSMSMTIEIAVNPQLRVNCWNNAWNLASNSTRILNIKFILLLEKVVFTKACFISNNFLGYIIVMITNWYKWWCLKKQLSRISISTKQIYLEFLSQSFINLLIFSWDLILVTGDHKTLREVVVSKDTHDWYPNGG